MVNITAGKWRGKSGAVYNVIDDLYDNSFWPFHDDVPGQENKRFWKADGTAWTGHVSGGDDLVAPAPAPTFSVGDRVRAIADSPRGEVGRVHSIDYFEDGGASYLVEFDTWRGGHEGDDDFPDDRGWWLSAWELERLPVTVTAGRRYKTRTGSVVGPMEKDDIGFLGYVDGYGRIFDGAGGHVFGDSDLDLVEEVSAPALKIEAGKYYRTRDGRKVGPMEKSDHDFWTGDGGYRQYKDDGSRRFGDDGGTVIVAEWPTTTSCAAAEVDNLRDEYGPFTAKPAAKFKVGDRVSYDDYRCSGVGTIHSENGTGALTGWLVIVDEKDRSHAPFDNGTTRIFRESDLRLVAPATATSRPAIVARLDNGQPRPATRPYVHADRASAEREAARLARANHGKEFAVYEFVSAAKEEPEHVWRRHALAGEREAAKRELRKLGIVGWSADIAVNDIAA